MKNLTFMKSPPLYLEFSREALIIFNGHDGAQFPLERAADGRLTAADRERLTTVLKQFLKGRGWPASSPGWCAIDARGVSLRCLLLPAVAGDGLRQVVRLQIESEFPLSPDELAWGYRLLGQPQRQPDGALKQAVLVAAVKIEIVSDYSEVLTAVGITPVFTVSALARSALCPQPPASYAVLELGPDQCELAGFEGDASAFVRVLAAGVPAGEAALDDLARTVGSHCRNAKLYIFGDADVTAQFARRLPIGLAVEPLKIAAGGGRSSATLGLEKIAEEQGSLPLPLLLKPVVGPKQIVEPALLEWGLRALFLLLAVLLFPSLEAMVCMKPLAEKVDAFKVKAGLVETNVDRDLGFLQDLQHGQPPFLESVYVISKAAPQGIHIDSLTMNRHGAVTLRGALRNGDQVADFRAKLISSGFFASVTVEEQSPTQDRQKVNVRMTAQWQPPAALRSLKIGPTEAELGTNAAASGPKIPGMPGMGGGN